jgi:hypothetical protein
MRIYAQPDQAQLVDWIVGQPASVIAVGLATRDREDPLGDQIPDAVRHPRRRARIGQRMGLIQLCGSMHSRIKPTLRRSAGAVPVA